MPSHYGSSSGRMRTSRRNTRMNTTRRNSYGNNRTTNTGNNNPITRTFSAPASPTYYGPNRARVQQGSPLHQHQDGTIMTEHAMRPNDNSVVVTTNGRNTQNRRTAMANGRTNSARRARTTSRRANRQRMNGNGRMNGNRRMSNRATRGSGAPFHGSGVVQQPGLLKNSDPVGGNRTYIQSGNDILSCPPGSMVITHECVKVVNPYLSNV